MEAERRPQQQEQPPHPHYQCPRCGSLETKFRYYNNHSLTQPRYGCKACKKLWTVGGSIRNTPNRGRIKVCGSSKPSSSRGNNLIPQPTQPWLSLAEEHLANSPFPPPLTTMVNTTMQFQPVTSSALATSRFEPYYFNDEISCFDVVQSLIQPEISNQQVNAGNYFFDAGVNVTMPQEWNVETLPLQHTMHHGIPTNVETYPPNLPMNSMSRNITTDLSFTTSDAGLWSNFNGGPTNTEDTTSVNVDEWLNFPEDDQP